MPLSSRDRQRFYLEGNIRTDKAYAGAKHFVNKPYVLDELVEVFKNVIENAWRVICESCSDTHSSSDAMVAADYIQSFRCPLISLHHDHYILRAQVVETMNNLGCRANRLAVSYI
jgi:hypothetical protein